MNAPKKTSSGPNSPYRIAAAARRAKIATDAPSADSVLPTMGRIRIALSGIALSRERQTAVFGPSSIDIPEFSLVRKTKQD